MVDFERTRSINRLADIFIDWLEEVHAHKDTCRGDDFADWTCCATHKRLKDETTVLRDLAKPIDGDEKVTTANWWRKVGRNDIADIILGEW